MDNSNQKNQGIQNDLASDVQQVLDDAKQLYDETKKLDVMKQDLGAALDKAEAASAQIDAIETKTEAELDHLVLRALAETEEE